MEPTTIAAYLILGCLVGVAGGMLGIGGGVLVIPALTILFHYTHRQAIGTSLGMLLPPIGIFAFLAYYRAGDVRLSASLLLACGFALGAFGGAWLASTGRVPESLLRVMFALFLLYYAWSLLLRSDRQAWGAAKAIGLAAAFGLAVLLFRLLGRRWQPAPRAAEIYRNNIRQTPPIDFEI